jgi:uncharacterized protein YqeY
VATITERVQSDMTAAAKAREQKRLATLRLLLDALKKESKAKREDLGEDAEIAVLKRERKRRAEAAEAYRAGGRAELAAAEDDEAALIDEYLPAQISDEELEALDREAHETVEAAVEFAKNGTDPRPEDALKNIYA